jgi:hypothetical protein
VSEPTFFQTAQDRVALALNGGVRVRVLDDGRAIVYGQTVGPPPDKLRRLVAEMVAESGGSAGTVDIRCSGNRWKVSASKSCGGERLEQRLRNVLGNS